MTTPEEKAEEWIEQQCALSPSCWCERDVSNAYLAGYEAAQMQWISVKDRLPENNTNVLAIYGEGKWLRYEVAHLYHDDLDDIHNWSRSDSTIYGVTHWMPLPEIAK